MSILIVNDNPAIVDCLLPAVVAPSDTEVQVTVVMSGGNEAATKATIDIWKRDVGDVPLPYTCMGWQRLTDRAIQETRIALLDWNLKGWGRDGSSVFQEMKKRGFRGRAIACSQDELCNEMLAQLGAVRTSGRYEDIVRAIRDTLY